MRRLVLCFLLAGCYSDTDRERAQLAEQDLTSARSNFFYYRLNTAPIDTRSNAIGHAIGDELDRALARVRKIAGDDE